MRNKNEVVFCTADQLEELADAFASEAKQLPAGEAKQEAEWAGGWPLRVCYLWDRVVILRWLGQI
jgi:hypothetical protein